MRRSNLFLLIAFLFSACAPAATVVPTLTPQPTKTLTPSPTATQTPSPTPTITPTPTQIGGGSGKLIFEYHRAGFEASFPDLEGEADIFISNVDGTGLIPVTNGLKGNNHIEAISSDGKMLLISSRSSYSAKGDLYLIHLNSLGADPIKLAGGIAVSRWPQAIFLDKARIAYIGPGSEGYGFYTANVDGTNPKKIGTLQAEFGGMVSSDKSRIYYKGWAKWISYWWINIDGSGQGKLESHGHQIIPNELFYVDTGEAAAFSPDGTKIAWIPSELEEDCSDLYLAFWTPDIRKGAYTNYVAKYAGTAFLPKDSPHVGKVIDTAYVEDYVRHCFLLHVASLSDLDKDTTIPLIPPFDPNKDNFYYHKDYTLRWWPDSSKILVYDGGKAMGRWRDTVTDHYPIALYEVSLKDPNPMLKLLTILSNSSIVQPDTGLHFVDNFGWFKFSPDSRQVLFTKYNYGNQGSMINVLNLETMNYIDDFSHNITPDFQIERVGNIYWLP